MNITVDAEINIQKMITLQSAIQLGTVEGLDQVGKHIVDLASQLAPKDSGDLSLSGRSALSGTTLEVSFGNDLPDDRAIAQEYGTIYMPAQPYLGPAIKEIDVVEEIATAIRKHLV